MNKQELYRKKYRELNPLWTDSLTIYQENINQNINQNTKILDVGCGHSNFMEQVFNKTKHTYGIDSDKKAIEKNTIIKNKIIGSANNIPLANNFFDLITLAWTLEHLDNPQKTFQEIYRVLKPKGKVIFLTPNTWNYNVWIIRAIPNVFHKPLVRYFYNRQNGDTYLKKYKINSIKKINQILSSVGFKKSQIILNGDPSYISFNKPLFRFACLIEKLLDRKTLNFAKVHIIGVYQK